MALKRAVLKRHTGAAYNLLSAGVLGDGFGSFRDGVLGQLSGQEQAHSSLDFATGDGRSFVVVSQTRRFGGPEQLPIRNEELLFQALVGFSFFLGRRTA